MKRLGTHFRVMSGSDERQYLTWVIWYPRTHKLLGYLYGSLKLPAIQGFITSLSALDVDDVLALTAISVFTAIVLLYAALAAGAL